MKSRLIKIYVDKKTSSFFIRATKGTDEAFILKDDSYGKALSSKVRNEELGLWVRKILENCE